MLKLSSRITNFLLLTALACAFLTTAVLPDTRMGVHPTSCGGQGGNGLSMETSPRPDTRMGVSPS